jgi:hypothetical protein
MMGRFTRFTALGVLFLLGGAVAAFADVMEEGLLECADYISSGEYDAPLEGHLIGTALVTETTETTTSTSAGVGGGPVPANAGATTEETTTVTEQYYVGYYSMSDGTTLRIDCRTYEYAK